MTVYRPDGVPTFGTEIVLWVTGPMDLLVIDRDALTVEIDALLDNAVVVSGAMRSSYGPTSEQTVGDDFRLSDSAGGQILGRTTLGMGELRYVYDPQLVRKSPPDPQAVHYDEMRPKTRGFYIDRRAVEAGDPIEVDQVVDIRYGQLGNRSRVPVEVGGDGTQPYEYTQVFASAWELQDLRIVAS